VSSVIKKAAWNGKVHDRRTTEHTTYLLQFLGLVLLCGLELLHAGLDLRRDVTALGQMDRNVAEAIPKLLGARVKETPFARSADAVHARESRKSDLVVLSAAPHFIKEASFQLGSDEVGVLRCVLLVG